jgi:outer membrane lipoprotein-sorting protein
MTLFETCGKIGAGVSVLVVLLFVALCLLVVACLIAGAYESVTNPNAANQTAQEYSALQQNISAGAGQLNHIVPGAGL